MWAGLIQYAEAKYFSLKTPLSQTGSDHSYALGIQGDHRFILIGELSAQNIPSIGYVLNITQKGKGICLFVDPVT